MSELYEKSLLKLELDQVLALLAECAGSHDGKEACIDYVLPAILRKYSRCWRRQLQHLICA